MTWTSSSLWYSWSNQHQSTTDMHQARYFTSYMWLWFMNFNSLTPWSHRREPQIRRNFIYCKIFFSLFSIWVLYAFLVVWFIAIHSNTHSTVLTRCFMNYSSNMITVRLQFLALNRSWKEIIINPKITDTTPTLTKRRVKKVHFSPRVFLSSWKSLLESSQIPIYFLLLVSLHFPQKERRSFSKD